VLLRDPKAQADTAGMMPIPRGGFRAYSVAFDPRLRLDASSSGRRDLAGVYTENPIRIDDVMESPKLAE